MYEKNQENSWIILGIKREKWKVDIFNALTDRKQIIKKSFEDYLNHDWENLMVRRLIVQNLGANYWWSHYTTEDSSPNSFIIELEDSSKKVNKEVNVT